MNVNYYITLLEIFLIIFNCVEGVQLTSYKIYEKHDINDKIKMNFTLKEPFTVNPKSARLTCLAPCNLNDDCLLVTLDTKLNICSMFNNQTSLINIINKTDMILFSKIELKTCINDDYYPDYENSICLKKKFYGEICLSSEECLEKLDLKCSNGKCIYRLIFFIILLI